MPQTEPPATWDAGRLCDPHGQPDKARRVRSMFDAIAPTYEMINRVASVGRDAAWRQKMVRLAEVRPDDVLLDVACGTGDVCRAFASASPAPAQLIGADFALRMLRFAQKKGSGASCRNGPKGASHTTLLTSFPAWCQADATTLPFPDRSFSLVTCAFGIRNFQSLDVGLGEIWRVLRPGGRTIILEFGMPSAPVLRALYRLYFNYLMPLAATMLSRDRSGAYRYLPRSVVSFRDQAGIVASLRQVGFTNVDVFPLTLGIVSIYRAYK